MVRGRICLRLIEYLSKHPPPHFWSNVHVVCKKVGGVFLGAYGTYMQCYKLEPRSSHLDDKSVYLASI